MSDGEGVELRVAGSGKWVKKMRVILLRIPRKTKGICAKETRREQSQTLEGRWELLSGSGRCKLEMETEFEERR